MQAEKKGQAKDKPAAEKASGAQPAAQPAAPSGEPARAGATKPFGGEKPAGAPGPAAAASAPSPAPAAAGRVERRVKMTRLRMRVAERLKGAQNTYAMLTTFNEVDMTALMDMRNKYKDAFQEKHGWVGLGLATEGVRAPALPSHRGKGCRRAGGDNRLGTGNCALSQGQAGLTTSRRTRKKKQPN